MAIECPYCRHSLGMKDPKPGRFSPKCPKCEKKFMLVVPSEPGAVPVVSAIRSEREAPPSESAKAAATMAGPVGSETMPAAEPQATGAWATAPPSQGMETIATGTVPPADANATGAWTTGPGSAPRMEETHVDTKAAGGATEATAAQGFDLATGVAESPSSSGSRPAGMPSVLGGYQVIKELGKGGMGAVYLAKQLSLDRNVALKVMRPEWASNPTFVSRFTREAYAAAQLVHHNVVQIYDFGEDKGTNFFSMEYVQGKTLSDLLKQEKKIDPEVAVGYMLQAARGLKYAHDQQMIHRDIKPDNLMLNDQGIVKVADLGLVKTPSAVEAEVRAEREIPVEGLPKTASAAGSSGQITMFNVAMGTPAFMAPEQGKDAAGVDARADIYSLGCTLYDLVTGRPPFEGKTAMELITKHQTEPIVPPERLVKRVPKTLSDIIVKMIAKRPEDRYANLGEVVKAFEDYLGVSSAGPFTPREEHANLLGECVETFYSAPTAKLRPKLLLGGAAACALLVLISMMAGLPLLAGGLICLGLMTTLAYFLVTGIARKPYLFTKVREFVFSSRPSDWLMGIAGLILLVAIVFVFQLQWAWLAFGVVAVLLAFGLYFGIDRKVEAERSEPVAKAEQMLKSMRLHGLDEEALRQFVCKYSGENWEEFYEALFGYEAKRIARQHWGRGEGARPRKTHATWREPIVAWIDAKQNARKAARERKLLQKIEEKGLEAQGVNLVTARRKAQRAADAMVAMAGEMKKEARSPAKAAKSEIRESIAQAMRKAAEKPEEVLVDREGLLAARSDGPLGLVIGPKPRFLVGAALLAGCLPWMNQNQMISGEKVKAAAAQAQEAAVKAAQSKDINAVTGAKFKVSDVLSTPKKTRPLRLPFLPKKITGLFRNFAPGVAGLILVISSFFRGVKIALFAVPGAAIALFGIPSAWLGMVAGAGLGVLGVVFGRTRA